MHSLAYSFGVPASRSGRKFPIIATASRVLSHNLNIRSSAVLTVNGRLDVGSTNNSANVAGFVKNNTGKLKFVKELIQPKIIVA